MSETLETAPPVESAAIDVAPTPAAEALPVETAAPEETGAIETPPPEPAPASPAEPTSDLSFEQAPPTVQPVDTSYELAVPEGSQVQPEQMAAFRELATKHSLPQDVAQGLLDQHLAVVQSMVAEQERRAQEHWDNLRTEMKAKSRADAEFGGEAYPASWKQMIAGRDVLVPEANRVGFDQLIKTYPGLDSHPEFQRMLFHAGQRWSQNQEMKSVMNARFNPVPQAPQQNRMEIVYPTMFASRQN